MTYRQKSLEWKQKAEALPPGEARDVFMAIAEGYADLALLHVAELQPKGTLHDQDR